MSWLVDLVLRLFPWAVVWFKDKSKKETKYANKVFKIMARPFTSKSDVANRVRDKIRRAAK